MRTTPERVKWDDAKCMGVAIHAEFGLGAKFSVTNTGLTKSQVHYRAKKFGIKRSDYRSGNGLGARVVLRNANMWIGYDLERKLRDRLVV